MNPLAGPWKDAFIDIDRASEFTGDDVDQISKLVDLGGNYQDLMVMVPTITSAVVSVMTQESDKADGTNEIPLAINILDDDATGHFVHGTTAGTGGFYIVFHIGGAQYIRIKAAANQGADRTFRVRGIEKL